jgi:Ca2+-binding RTX toxin-like protein
LNGGGSGYDKVVDSGFGDDWVKTNGGDDTIDAGVGQDTAIGGEGNDTYVWSLGDAHYTDANGDFVVGIDIIDDASIASYETDRLELKEVDSDQVTLTRTTGSDDLIITIGANGVGGTITVQNQFENINNGKGIEEIAFADGVVWGLDDIITQTTVSGTSVGDTLNGISDYDESFYGNAGADVIDANGGDDILVGGLGYDSLNGGNGNDLYYWSSGDGSDIVNDDGVSTTETDTLVLTDINSADVTLLRNGEDLQVAIDEDHDGVADEVIVVQERFSANGDGSGIEIIEFADGVRTSVLSGTIAEAYVWGTGSSDGSLNGWAYTDTIYGFSGADSISGNGGDDLLVGGNGLDTLDGGAGSDTYHWSAGHGYDVIRDTDTDLAETDTLVFTDIASDDVLLTHNSGGNDLHITVLSTGEIITVEDQFVSTQNGKGLEAISFSDGVTWLLDDIYGYTSVLGDLEIDPQVSNSNQDTLNGVGDFDENFYGLTGNDTINAGAGDDFIVGGLGDDVLNGGDGNDTYQWSTGSGEDEINDDGTSALETDRLVLNGVQPADVTLTRVSGTDDLMITIATTNGDKVLTVEGQFKDADAGYGLEAIEFADGTVWLIADIVGNTLVQGDASDNTLIGESSFDETFEGYLGVDTINAGFGDDQISGGLGDDILDGEQGSDTYIWSSGDGDDVIDDDGTSINDFDRLVLTNIDADDVMLERVVGSDDLTVVINGTARITLKDQYLSSSTTEGIEIIEFADDVWSLDKILSSVVLVGSNSGETINSSDLTDVIEGRGGADIINGKGGDDILIGGYGADTLNGGAGVDTASYEDAANGVEIDLGLMGPQIGGFGDVHKDDTLIDIENVTGSNLEDVLSGDDGANILTGNDGDDLISGGGGYDVINGGRGDDSLNGGSGKDEFLFAIGDGADFITDFEDALDVLIIEDLTFTDLVISQNGSDTLIELDSFTSITLEGVISSDVTEDDFKFV